MIRTLAPLRHAARAARPLSGLPARRWQSSSQSTHSPALLPRARPSEANSNHRPFGHSCAHQARPCLLLRHRMSPLPVLPALTWPSPRAPVSDAVTTRPRPRRRSLRALLRNAQDGVLKQGERVLPQALEVMRILTGDNKKGKKYPFILVSPHSASTRGVVDALLTVRCPPAFPSRR